MEIAEIQNNMDRNVLLCGCGAGSLCFIMSSVFFRALSSMKDSERSCLHKMCDVCGSGTAK